MPDPAPAAPRPQHLEALDRANYARTRRAAILRDLKRHDRPIAAALLGDLDDGDADAMLNAVPVRDVLTTVYRVGGISARAILETARVPHEITLGGLSRQRRQKVLDVLRHVAPWCDGRRTA